MLSDLLNNINFDHPWVLLFILIIPLILFLIRSGREKVIAIKFPSSSGFGASRSFKVWLRKNLSLYRFLALFLLILALSGPKLRYSDDSRVTEGIDIVLCTDISTSMLAKDFIPNRIEAAKGIAAEFINTRVNDRVGIVVYADGTYTICPLTSDKKQLINSITNVNVGLVSPNRTAIGDGIATAVNRLKDSHAKSKVIILLSDGENNAGNIDPMQAAEIAGIYGIRIYSVGVGTMGKALMPSKQIMGQLFYDYMPVRIDEKTLSKAAEISGGKYFRATDNKKLQAIYTEIDNMEKSRLRIVSYNTQKHLYPYLVMIAGLLLLIEFLLRYVFVKSVME